VALDPFSVATLSMMLSPPHPVEHDVVASPTPLSMMLSPPMPLSAMLLVARPNNIMLNRANPAATSRSTGQNGRNYVLKWGSRL
ncbi:MAG: hypothetical protein WBB15_04385, partial [Ornithinimicrobium sp.]